VNQQENLSSILANVNSLDENEFNEIKEICELIKEENTPNIPKKDENQEISHFHSIEKEDKDATKTVDKMGKMYKNKKTKQNAEKIEENTYGYSKETLKNIHIDTATFEYVKQTRMLSEKKMNEHIRSKLVNEIAKKDNKDKVIKVIPQPKNIKKEDK
jgi:hypothetical protein